MQLARLLVLISLIIYIIIPEKLHCDDHHKMLRNYMLAGYAWHGTAIAEDGYVIQTMINMKTRDWLFIRLDQLNPIKKDLNACELMRGNTWAFPLEDTLP